MTGHIERDQAIVEAIRAGERATAVAKQHGLSRERARQIWKRETGEACIPKRPRRVPVVDCPACGSSVGPWAAHRVTAGHPPVTRRKMAVALEAIRLYGAGESMIRIAYLLDEHLSAVARWLHAANVEIRSQRGHRRPNYRLVSDGERAEIRALVASGETPTRVAGRYGRGIQHVQRIARGVA